MVVPKLKTEEKGPNFSMRPTQTMTSFCLAPEQEDWVSTSRQLTLSFCSTPTGTPKWISRHKTEPTE